MPVAAVGDYYAKNNIGSAIIPGNNRSPGYLEETVQGNWGPEKVQDDATGFAFNAGGGIMFFRTYDFRLTADLRYQYVAHTFEGLENDQTQSVMFTIGFAYARGRHRW